MSAYGGLTSVTVTATEVTVMSKSTSEMLLSQNTEDLLKS